MRLFNTTNITQSEGEPYHPVAFYRGLSLTSERGAASKRRAGAHAGAAAPRAVFSFRAARRAGVTRKCVFQPAVRLTYGSIIKL